MFSDFKIWNAAETIIDNTAMDYQTSPSRASRVLLDKWIWGWSSADVTTVFLIWLSGFPGTKRSESWNDSAVHNPSSISFCLRSSLWCPALGILQRGQQLVAFHLEKVDQWSYDCAANHRSWTRHIASAGPHHSIVLPFYSFPVILTRNKPMCPIPTSSRP